MKVSWVVRLYVMFEYNIDKHISLNISYSNSFIYMYYYVLSMGLYGFCISLHLVPLLLYIAVVVASS